MAYFNFIGKELDMLENFKREIKKLTKEGVSVPVELPSDSEGFFDRKCPSLECLADFKIFRNDWREKVDDNHVYCPKCRHEAPSTEWRTPYQTELLRQANHKEARRRITQAISKDVRRFNQAQPKRGLISISMSYKPGKYFYAPIEAIKLLERKYSCEACGCRYLSLASAFFCPACGHSSASITFEDDIKAIRELITNISSVRSSMTAISGVDAAEDMLRHIIESSFESLIGDFQYSVKEFFDKLPNRALFSYRRNAFQNLNEGSGLWKRATGTAYEDILTPDELSSLQRYIQQRHLLSHCNGIVDQDYLDKTSDSTYTVGQRLIIREGSVLQLADLVCKLTRSLQGIGP
jgi:uncharacterized Zn finger protein (UPF0148 family)